MAKCLLLLVMCFWGSWAQQLRVYSSTPGGAYCATGNSRTGRLYVGFSLGGPQQELIRERTLQVADLARPLHTLMRPAAAAVQFRPQHSLQVSVC